MLEARGLAGALHLTAATERCVVACWDQLGVFLRCLERANPFLQVFLCLGRAQLASSTAAESFRKRHAGSGAADFCSSGLPDASCCLQPPVHGAQLTPHHAEPSPGGTGGAESSSRLGTGKGGSPTFLWCHVRHLALPHLTSPAQLRAVSSRINNLEGSFSLPQAQGAAASSC